MRAWPRSSLHYLPAILRGCVSPATCLRVMTKAWPTHQGFPSCLIFLSSLEAHPRTTDLHLTPLSFSKRPSGQLGVVLCRFLRCEENQPPGKTYIWVVCTHLLRIKALLVWTLFIFIAQITQINPWAVGLIIWKFSIPVYIVLWWLATFCPNMKLST